MCIRDRVRAIHYVADFAYERPTAPDKYGTVIWLPVVEDVKSRACLLYTSRCV